MFSAISFIRCRDTSMTKIMKITANSRHLVNYMDTNPDDLMVGTSYIKLRAIPSHRD